MAPAFATVAAEFEPRLRFAKLDTEAHPQIAARYKIQSLPTLVLFRGGHEVDRVSGALPAGEIRRWVSQHAKR
jgi:thioredoxin 2